MEAATITEQEPETQTPPAANGTPAQLFRYSTWVHVGPGADGCEEGEQGTCANPLHFHAWCRLPNQFQHREIREKALAARARRTRQLRDPHSDAHAVLEDDMDQIARLGDRAKPDLIDELLSRDWWRDYLEAVKDVKEHEDERGDKPFARIEQDQERFAQLQLLDADKRPQTEYDELERHLKDYADKVTERHNEITQPRRDALNALDLNQLIDEVRDARITTEASAEFMHVYSVWEWFAGTLTRPGGERKFTSIDHMQQAAPEVIDALKSTYDDLEQTQNAVVTAGNS